MPYEEGISVASNYEDICKENKESYGTKGAQKSGELAAGLYDDRTHFIFELLQNAEDALGRRGDWNGSRNVTFALTSTSLALSHFGRPFDEADVRSVCDIAESTKNESSIGRFGLGFKSVYTITDYPEIHSGEEDFVIENFVFPKLVERSARKSHETQIILPLKSEDESAAQDITAGFHKLGASSLLFLRHIDEISWNVEGGASGFYMRNSPEILGPNVQRISLIGNEDGQPEVEQNWLVFHRDVSSAGGQKTGRVEIAFSLVAKENTSGHWAVQPLAKSPLVVFFPTVVESHLGFLVQGPYLTTPSRDNIPPSESWNQHLVLETSILLLDAIRWMRDNAMLDIATLRCLPLDSTKFSKDSRFASMFEIVRQAFKDEALLPTFDGRFVAAQRAKLARTQELRELLNPEQIAMLFGSEVEAWLSEEITQDKTPEIHHYIKQELNVDEITPTKLITNLTKSFLEAQPDEWILQFYEFLSGQEKTIRPHLDKIPFIRLEDGTHVVARNNGKINVFLPSTINTGFPTIRSSVCATPEVSLFLTSLGITEPDLVDDVMWNLLPKYQKEEVNVSDIVYAADIERILAAFKTDSTAKKEKLRAILRDTWFVMAADTGSSKKYIAKPGDVYVATERLQQLFAGVSGVLTVDSQYDCLRGEDIRDLLVSCGASRYLTPQLIPSKLKESEKAQIRKEAGLQRASWHHTPEDFTLRGLLELLDLLPSLKPRESAARVKILWDALNDLEARGNAAFLGSYKWGYSHETKTAWFDASFVRVLNQAAWIPNSDNKLVQPGLVVFDSLGWKSNPFLLSKIKFKPSIIDQLAKETGIDPAILDLLRNDPAIVAELSHRLSIGLIPEPESDIPMESDTDTASNKISSDEHSNIDGSKLVDRVNSGQVTPQGGDLSNGNTAISSGGFSFPDGERNTFDLGKRISGNAGARPFVSYVAVHPNDDDSDPDALEQSQRMLIESKAIDLIIELEPSLRRTPEGNPGFDLFEVNERGQAIRWIEVKSMTGTLKDRPVGLSCTQFDVARERGNAYWLYIVEKATDPAQSRILRIQNPAGHARTFTFDHGWSEIAHTELPD
jgi:hypothetical protein